MLLHIHSVRVCVCTCTYLPVYSSHEANLKGHTTAVQTGCQTGQTGEGQSENSGTPVKLKWGCISVCQSGSIPLMETSQAVNSHTLLAHTHAHIHSCCVLFVCVYLCKAISCWFHIRAEKLQSEVRCFQSVRLKLDILDTELQSGISCDRNRK